MCSRSNGVAPILFVKRVRGRTETTKTNLVLKTQVEIRQEAVDLHGIASLSYQSNRLAVPLYCGVGENGLYHSLHHFLPDSPCVKLLPVPSMIWESLLHQVITGSVLLNYVSVLVNYLFIIFAFLECYPLIPKDILLLFLVA